MARRLEFAPAESSDSGNRARPLRVKAMLEMLFWGGAPEPLRRFLRACNLALCNLGRWLEVARCLFQELFGDIRLQRTGPSWSFRANLLLVRSSILEILRAVLRQ